MGVKVRNRGDGTIAGTDLPDDGSLAEVIEWRGFEHQVGWVVQRMGDDLVYVGHSSHERMSGYFGHEGTHARVRLLEAPAVLEITKD